MAETIVQFKKCFLCGENRPTTDFYKKSDKRDGLASRCRECFKKPRPQTRLYDKRFIDLTGQRFGLLTVISVLEPVHGSGFKWACLCDCENTTAVASSNLMNGNQTSCGCMKNAKAAARQYIHGMADSREYKIWSGIKKRCFNRKNKDYANYGGRGITMCADWRKSFDAFFRDMGPSPLGLTIDRINNDGNYEAGNCRWATRTEQNRNRRNTTVKTIANIVNQ